MGIAQAGIAFRVSTPINDLPALMTRVFDEPVVEIASPVATRFDIRNHGDVMVQIFGDVCFICNDDLAWPLLKDASADAARLHAVLGRPERLMAFCHYPAGGSHGYALFENGQRLRTRLQTDGVPELPPLLESGSPQPFERRWLGASHFVDRQGAGAAKVYYLGNRDVLLPERELGGRLLQDGMVALLGICPWQTLLTATYRFFRVGTPGPGRVGEVEACSITAGVRAAPPRRRWWRLRSKP